MGADVAQTTITSPVIAQFLCPALKADIALVRHSWIDAAVLPHYPCLGACVLVAASWCLRLGVCHCKTLDNPMPRFFLPLAFVFLTPMAHAGELPAAKLRSAVGTVLQKGGGKGWLAPVLHDNIPAGAQLLTLPGARGVLEVKEGDVRLILAGNLPETSEAPVLESAISLPKPAADLDLEFTLERGRVIIENHKD